MDVRRNVPPQLNPSFARVLPSGQLQVYVLGSSTQPSEQRFSELSWHSLISEVGITVIFMTTVI